MNGGRSGGHRDGIGTASESAAEGGEVSAEVEGGSGCEAAMWVIFLPTRTAYNLTDRRCAT